MMMQRRSARLAPWFLSLIGVLYAGCTSRGITSSESHDTDTGGPDGTYASVRGPDGAGDGTGTPGEGGGTSTPTSPEGEGGSAQPGTLTAGAWDDNRNFEFFSKFRSQMQTSSADSIPGFTDEEASAAHERFGGERAGHETLDIALVIDTTGSMGDEITYLQTEFVEIATRVYADHPDADTRWALVLYKDVGDEYVVRTADFTADAMSFRDNLAAASASGGGDFPEAPDQALAETSGLSWRSGEGVARLAFWVGDAPQHAERSAALADAVRSLSQLDVHIYPVASSGVDAVTEMSMRASAQVTGGRYLFLTNDSGVGGDHLEPTVPCYFVTRLDSAILRMVDIEMSGTYREPAAEEIIRTGGDPEEGACTLEGGDVVTLF